jgi:hypothetical protein
VALLTSCLALVRPVGMGDHEAEGWLRVALGEVREFPLQTLSFAAKHARRTCTHHAQIVPTIVKFCEENLPQPVRDPWGGVELLPPPPKPVPELTQEAVDVMSPELIRIGLTTKALIREKDGRVVVNRDG